MVRFRFSKGLNREPDPKNVKLHIHSGSSSRALNAILPLVASGQPYEAHQKTRTFTSRYSKSGQYDTAIDVLFQSARELLKVSQHCPAGDQVQPLPHLIPSLLKAPAPPNQMSGLALSSERVAGAGEVMEPLSLTMPLPTPHPTRTLRGRHQWWLRSPPTIELSLDELLGEEYNIYMRSIGQYGVMPCHDS
ncbi:hypothetical protein EV424DRAFT_1586315 [Suillus variegatus]|nr:hypothetical protein EV424DRAFT_1586315 [Suillus variegatus]